MIHDTYTIYIQQLKNYILLCQNLTNIFFKQQGICIQIQTLINMQGSKDIYKSPQLEFDQEGFVKSFDLQTCNKEQLSAFYHKFGFIIFRDIISEEEANLTIDSLWTSTIQHTKRITKNQIVREDKATWDFIRGSHKNFGFVNSGFLKDIQFWRIRQHPRVYQAFQKAYEANTGQKLSEPLLACLDRGSMMLPSALNQQWETQPIYHFDIDPWKWVGNSSRIHRKYNYDPNSNYLMLGQGNYEQNIGYTKFAGVLALSQTNDKSGGFQCACGFQNFIRQWCQEHPNYIHIQQDPNLVANFKKLFMRKRSLLVFSRELPHNIYCNTSQNFRYAQYLRMTPLSSLILDKQLFQKRKQLIKTFLPPDLNVDDPISQEIFMLNLSAQEALEKGLLKKDEETKYEFIKSRWEKWENV